MSEAHQKRWDKLMARRDRVKLIAVMSKRKGSTVNGIAMALHYSPRTIINYRREARRLGWL